MDAQHSTEYLLLNIAYLLQNSYQDDDGELPALHLSFSFTGQTLEIKQVP